MPGLTIVYYTANYANESFTQKVRERLLLSIGKLPLVSVSQKPMKFGKNICVGKIRRSSLTVHRQILVGVQAVETKYVALVEDDTLYPPEHFKTRPLSDNVFAYNLNKWTLFIEPPIFSRNKRSTNSVLIASRELLVEAIKERLDKIDNNSERFRECKLKWLGEPGRQKCERNLGVMLRDAVAVYTDNPVVTIYHSEGMGYRSLGKKKKIDKIRATEIPYWGKAEDVINKYYVR